MIYAIDFGTSNSLLSAATEQELFQAIPLDPDAKDPSIMRSILYLPDAQRCYFGAKATQEYVSNDMEGRLIRSIKKFLPVRSFLGTFVNDKAFYIEDIIATFLGEMRRRANTHFNKDVDSVLLGRPARFAEDDADDRFAQDRLETAANRAGFKHVEFCPEPLAAAYEFKATITEPKIIFVADFGGGTSDFTVIRLTPESTNEVEVLALGGVSVAGDALDGSLMRGRIAKHFGAEVQYQVPFGSNVLTMPKHLMEKICSPAEISVLRERDTQEFFRNVKSWSLGPEDHQKMDNLFSLIHEQIGFSVFEEIEGTKRRLSDAEVAEFVFKYSGMDLREKFTRTQFEEYAGIVIRRILRSMDDTMRAAGLQYGDVDLVCATGGTAKVFALRAALSERFGEEKIQQHKNFHSIVYGLSRVAQGML
ncbi:MAG: Hsp70 family protein [Bacteriovoracia bacterium]